MFNWLSGDPLKNLRKDLSIVDKFANLMIKDIEHIDIVRARKHANLVFAEINKLNDLAEHFFEGFRQIQQTNKLKNLVSKKGIIFTDAKKLRDELHHLTPEKATEEKLHTIKSLTIRLDENTNLAKELAEWVRRNEGIVKIKSKIEKRPIIPENVVGSSVVTRNIKKIKINKAIREQLTNILYNISRRNWRREKTKSYTDTTDLLGLKLKGHLRLTYYETINQIRICQIYTDHERYMRDLRAKKKSDYKGFRPIEIILREAGI